jgi:hypothetical protein
MRKVFALVFAAALLACGYTYFKLIDAGTALTDTSARFAINTSARSPPRGCLPATRSSAAGVLYCFNK